MPLVAALIISHTVQRGRHGAAYNEEISCCPGIVWEPLLTALGLPSGQSLNGKSAVVLDGETVEANWQWTRGNARSERAALQDLESAAAASLDIAGSARGIVNGSDPLTSTLYWRALLRATGVGGDALTGCLVATTLACYSPVAMAITPVLL